MAKATKKELRNQEKIIERILKNENIEYDDWLYEIHQNYISSFLDDNADVLVEAIQRKQAKENNKQKGNDFSRNTIEG